MLIDQIHQKGYAIKKFKDCFEFENYLNLQKFQKMFFFLNGLKLKYYKLII
jgi:hypothetical protein